jgi:hypothetical protein
MAINFFISSPRSTAMDVSIFPSLEQAEVCGLKVRTSPLPPTVSLLSLSACLDNSCRRRRQTPIPPQWICHNNKPMKIAFLHGRKGSERCRLTTGRSRFDSQVSTGSGQRLNSVSENPFQDSRQPITSQHNPAVCDTLGNRSVTGRE